MELALGHGRRPCWRPEVSLWSLAWQLFLAPSVCQEELESESSGDPGVDLVDRRKGWESETHL